MAHIHNGTATTLAAKPKADCSNNDTANIWLNGRSVQMVYDSTATNTTDITNGATTPYYIRPDDYGAGPGVWIEDAGVIEENIRLPGDHIIGSQLTSTNWGATAGSQYDLDLAKFRLGGSNVDAAGSAAGIFWGLDSGLYKGYVGDGSNVYWKFDGAALTISVNANVGTGVGVLYKDAKRWLYDFNPAHNGTVQPDGYNLFLGVEAGNLNMGGTATIVQEASRNVGIGYRPLYSLTTGNRNVAIGYQCLYSTNTGYTNVGIGSECLYTMTGGINNTAMGIRALYTLGSAIGNVAIGYECMLADTTGEYNTAVGWSALISNTTGDFNVAVGTNAGRFQNDYSTGLETPENSVYIGRGASSGSDPAGGEDAIANEIVLGGNITVGNGSNSVTLGDTSITALHCQVALTVDSDERIKRNIHPSLVGLAFINALNPITFQAKNPFDYPNEIKPPGYKDRKIKEKDQHGKEKFKLIKAEKRPTDNNKIYLGLSAQQVEEVMTVQGVDLELVSTSNRGKKAITYGNLIMPLITAVQELSQRVEALESR